jgi:hypothetical protein
MAISVRINRLMRIRLDNPLPTGADIAPMRLPFEVPVAAVLVLRQDDAPYLATLLTVPVGASVVPLVQ